MIEPELAFADLHDDMACATAYLQYVVGYFHIYCFILYIISVLQSRYILALLFVLYAYTICTERWRNFLHNSLPLSKISNGLPFPLVLGNPLICLIGAEILAFGKCA